MATTLSVWVTTRASLITIVLAIPLNALLLLDFTRTILGTFAFHLQFSFPRLYIFCCQLSPSTRSKDVRRKNRNETAQLSPTRLFSLQVTTLLFVFSVSFQRSHQITCGIRFLISLFHLVTRVSSLSLALLLSYRRLRCLYKTLS